MGARLGVSACFLISSLLSRVSCSILRYRGGKVWTCQLTEDKLVQIRQMGKVDPLARSDVLNRATPSGVVRHGWKGLTGQLGGAGLLPHSDHKEMFGAMGCPGGSTHVELRSPGCVSGRGETKVVACSKRAIAWCRLKVLHAIMHGRLHSEGSREGEIERPSSRGTS